MRSIYFLVDQHRKHFFVIGKINLIEIIIISLIISQDQDSAVLKEKSFPTKVIGDEELAGNSLGD